MVAEVAPHKSGLPRKWFGSDLHSGKMSMLLLPQIGGVKILRAGREPSEELRMNLSPEHSSDPLFPRSCSRDIAPLTTPKAYDVLELLDHTLPVCVVDHALR